MKNTQAYVNKDSDQRCNPRRTSRLYWHLRCLRDAMESIVNSHVAGKSIEVLVDFGCGEAPYRQLFERHVDRYDTCDLAGNPVAQVEIDPAGCIALETNTTDLVLSTQVLEHVESPASYLAECHRILKPHGLLVLSTHGAWRFHPSPMDYWRWTSQGIIKVLQDGGFGVIDSRAIMAPASYSLQLLQDSMMRGLPKWILPAFFGTMQLFIQVADRCSSNKRRMKDAAVFLVVARKS